MAVIHPASEANASAGDHEAIVTRAGLDGRQNDMLSCSTNLIGGLIALSRLVF